MHAVIEGVTKTLLSAFFDSKHSTCSFYLGQPSIIREIYKRLHRIKRRRNFEEHQGL